MLLMQAYLLVATLVVSAQCSSSILFVDSTSGSYLADNNKVINMQSSSLSSLMSALTGLMLSAVDEDASSAIEKVLKPSPLKKPRAHIVLNIAGIPNAMLADLFDGKSVLEVQLQDDEDTSAVAIVDSLTSIASTNPDVAVSMLDYKGLEGCMGNCLEEYLPAASSYMLAEHSDSQLTFPTGVRLDFDSLSDKMFAIEATSLYAGLQAQIQQLSFNLDQDIQILETTLLGLQGLEATYGPDSEVVISAREALCNLVKWAVSSLDESFKGDVTYQVTGFKGAPKKNTVQEIMGWKQERRRSLLSTTPSSNNMNTNNPVYPPTNQTAAAQIFTAKACGYGAFILLLYFGIAAIWCMCFMPLKQDTMLFGAKKQD
ncbi:hypothetical protein CEUSTIGMA_g6257.t1 [Chlamydomonas eustigma]|uniref:DUF7794 domain-containing protein n=1 Tax=Chlamydomonas eustigma TaxID=1157962 RepID=A0A250X7T2_9CHLO|nr:hypothetical protein CEUSTIGMA_g6257.t1 [Chlamydomonas eustigma]|eukprot:GAX78820.1 hypothetical protein CEUSTIGMA_g6257.t1 [Chlamydomonas eustigma]